MIETCVKTFSLAGKYIISIYSIQKHWDKIEIKNSSVNKKKVKSNSFQVWLVQGLGYMTVV